MDLFSIRNLKYKDYQWKPYLSNDPHVCGLPDTTPFNPGEGNEMVYLINALMGLLNYKHANTGNKIEKLIHEQLPPANHNQEQVKDWVISNLKF